MPLTDAERARIYRQRKKDGIVLTRSDVSKLISDGARRSPRTPPKAKRSRNEVAIQKMKVTKAVKGQSSGDALTGPVDRVATLFRALFGPAGGPAISNLPPQPKRSITEMVDRSTKPREVNRLNEAGACAGSAGNYWYRAALEDAALRLEMNASTIQLHAGEMTAGEIRSVQAVLKWKAAEIRRMAGEDSQSSEPQAVHP